MYILLIESDTVLAGLYTQALTAAGHQVSSTAEAEAAIHLADDTLFDAVVLELQLSGHNGLEFIHEFRSYPEWQAIPIILHTLVAPQALQLSPEMASAMGVVAYLYKPTTTTQQLVDQLADLSVVAA